MKIYKIPILYQAVQIFEFQAESLEDAITKSLNEFLAIPDDNYICDSFEIDSIVDDDYPDEDYDINKIIQKL
jgi:hypothetical protein